MRCYQSQMDLMRDWLDFRDDFMFEILSTINPPPMKSCSSCQTVLDSVYRCTDCFGGSHLCLKCCLEDHSRLPFHQIQKWNGRYFAPTTLQDLGYILHLGHGGLRCPSSGEAENSSRGDSTSTLTVMDIGCIHTHVVSWCKCSGAGTKPIQLLRMGLYPGSTHSPRTAFTFRLLDYYHMDSTECNVTSQSFCMKLKRLTNRYHPDEVPVSTIYQTWRRSGSSKTEPIQGTHSGITTMERHPSSDILWMWPWQNPWRWGSM